MRSKQQPRPSYRWLNKDENGKFFFFKILHNRRTIFDPLERCYMHNRYTSSKSLARDTFIIYLCKCIRKIPNTAILFIGITFFISFNSIRNRYKTRIKLGALSSRPKNVSALHNPVRECQYYFV